MTEEYWRSAFAIFEAACELPPEKRRAYIENSLDDPDAVARLLGMLDRLDEAAPPEASSYAGEPAPGETTWPQLGRTLGRFRITAPLGHGGAGEVYAAEDTELGRTVALKFLSTRPDAALAGGSQSLTPRSLDRFIREARAASSLNHPGIVTVHEVIRDGEATAIVMELVEGAALRKHCGPPHRVEQVAGWGRQIAQALAAAHARGIVHRDIKPENLMVRPDGYVKVLDFGLARYDETPGQPDAGATVGPLVGTLRYMSPEQALGRTLTGASDVFSLGIVLYELVTGFHPFPAPAALETPHAIATREPLATDALGALDEIIRRMLNKDPSLRPSAADVAKALAAIESPLTRESSPPAQKSRAWPIAVGLGVAAGLGLALLVGIKMQSKPAGHPAPATVTLLPSTPLTSLPGAESDAAFSPDGKQIAYAWNGGQGERCSIYVRELGADNSRRLTAPGEDDFNPTWSADGREIAFLRHENDRFQIVIAALDGGKERPAGSIRSSPMGTVHMKFLAWSRDPNTMVVADDPPGQPDNSHLYSMQLNSMQLSSGTRRVLGPTPEGANDISPAFSPDGQSLAFLRWDHGAAHHLLVMNRVGSAAKLLASSPMAIDSFAWTADGKKILYVTLNRIWQVDASGSAPQAASFSLEGEMAGLTVAPQGRKMAYVSRYEDTNIWRFSKGRLDELIASTRQDTDPRYSPDGKKIAFNSKRSGIYQIWVSESDGSNPRMITSQPGGTGSPSWSPDGTQIAFDTEGGGHAEVWIIGAEGGAARRLLSKPAESFIPNWSSDGKWIYFCSGQSGSLQIWKAPLEGAAPPAQVTYHGGFEGRESADGKFLYFSKSDDHSANPVTGVWRLPVDGSGPEELVGAGASVGKNRDWDLTPTGLYFLDLASPRPLLRCFDLRTKRVTAIGTFARPPAPFQRALAAAPDGSAFLYVQIDASRQEIRLVENFTNDLMLMQRP
jgi:Tol biopolymer transport system component